MDAYVYTTHTFLPSIHPLIHWSIDPSIHRSIHPLIHPLIHWSSISSSSCRRVQGRIRLSCCTYVLTVIFPFKWTTCSQHTTYNFTTNFLPSFLPFLLPSVPGGMTVWHTHNYRIDRVCMVENTTRVYTTRTTYLRVQSSYCTTFFLPTRYEDKRTVHSTVLYTDLCECWVLGNMCGSGKCVGTVGSGKLYNSFGSFVMFGVHRQHHMLSSRLW